VDGRLLAEKKTFSVRARSRIMTLPTPERPPPRRADAQAALVEPPSRYEKI